MSHMVVPGRAPESSSRLFGTSGVRGIIGQDLTLVNIVSIIIH